MSAIDWFEEETEESGISWCGFSPYHHDDHSFSWRLREAFAAGDHMRVWFEDHDAELMEEGTGRFWYDLESAKAAIQKDHDEIISENIKENSP